MLAKMLCCVLAVHTISCTQLPKVNGLSSNITATSNITPVSDSNSVPYSDSKNLPTRIVESAQSSASKLQAASRDYLNSQDPNAARSGLLSAFANTLVSSNPGDLANAIVGLDSPQHLSSIQNSQFLKSANTCIASKASRASGFKC